MVGVAGSQADDRRREQGDAAGEQRPLEARRERVRGTVHSFAGDTLRIRSESALYLRQLRPGTRLQIQVMARAGTLEATVNLVNAQDELATLQLVGQPHLVQRRGHARVAVRLAATLTGVIPITGGLLQVRGHTQNVSMGGALIRFPQPPERLPKGDLATLLGLDIPDGAGLVSVVLAVHAVQVWEAGARLRFIGLQPDQAALLGRFLEPHLP